jgi:uncharacterized protein YecE (DUF72 family)
VGVEEDEGESAPLVATASWGYLRLRRTVYSPAELAAWAERLRAQPWQEAYVFFKHEEDGPVTPGSGPDAAVSLQALVRV